jgi:hypothetical protein
MLDAIAGQAQGEVRREVTVLGVGRPVDIDDGLRPGWDLRQGAGERGRLPGPGDGLADVVAQRGDRGLWHRSTW